MKKKKSVSKKNNKNSFNRNILIGVVVLVILFTFAYYGGGYERVDNTGGLNQVSGQWDLGYLTDMMEGIAETFSVGEPS